MRIGYPCINRGIGCRSGATFRLASYSEERLMQTVQNNLNCLLRILKFNGEKRILFFRITSDLVPFASHPVCRFPWQRQFAEDFERIGEFVRNHDIRISMHPDQFTLINTPDEAILERSCRELAYHADILDCMGLPSTAKVQVHIGGVYHDREKSMERFVERYLKLEEPIKSRLVIENDDRLYTLSDCLDIHARTGAPVLLDIFHHRVKSSGESTGEAVRKAGATWTGADGPLMVDYSSQQPGKRAGVHAESIDLQDFSDFLEISSPCNMDIMLEIKDKEKSALAAIEVAASDPRFSG